MWYLKIKTADSLYNFYEGETCFTLTADIVNQYNTPGSIVFALYDGNKALQAVQSADAGGETLELTFDGFEEKMTSEWDLKAITWDSISNMNPLAAAKSMKKTYGYENVIDTSKPLKIVYFGDSQTQGGRFTTPLTEMFAAPKGRGKDYSGKSGHRRDVFISWHVPS